MRVLPLLLALLLPPAARAQSSFELTPATTTVLLGAPVELTGRARLPLGASLALALDPPSTGAFTVVDVRIEPAPAEPGAAVYDLRLKVAAFELGDVVLPALPWTLNLQGAPPQRVHSPPVSLKVVAPRSALEDPVLRDIRAPLSPALWPWLLTPLLLAGLLGGLWERRRRRTSAGTDATGAAPDLRTPDEIALDELEALPSLGLPVKDYYDRMSDIVRAYLEKRYGLPALKMTTFDLIREMRRREIDPPAVRALAKALFDRCDLAKFARWSPESSESLKDLAAAKELIRQASRQAFAERIAGVAPPAGGTA